MKNVLWLVSWYPNRMDKFDGDFIQRHARAVAMFCKLHVIYVKKDDSLVANKNEIESLVSDNLIEQVIYYNSVKTGLTFLDKFLSQQQYKKLYQQAIHAYIAASGKPALVHVHVAMKAGVAALWVKKKWGIDYIVSEHWTAYLKEADQRIGNHPFVFKNLLKKVLQEAAAVTVVSNHLGRSIQERFPVLKYQVIPNVVDTSIFFPVATSADVTMRFIHISNMNYQKNTEAIIEAMSLLKNNNVFQLDLYGPVNNALQELIDYYGLTSSVFLKGEVKQVELAKALQASDALILYSRFETFGCVLIEANACGVPVIVSDLPVFHELLEEGVNAVFVEGENSAVLAEKIKQFIQQKNGFNKIEIATATAAKYNYKKIGRQVIELYEKIQPNAT